jgi:hypothetical protein
LHERSVLPKHPPEDFGHDITLGAVQEFRVIAQHTGDRRIDAEFDLLLDLFLQRWNECSHLHLLNDKSGMAVPY